MENNKNILLRIEIKGRMTSLVLEKIKGEEIDRVGWNEENNLSRVILSEIDSLLLKNNIAVDDIKEVLVDSDIPDKFTTARIAKAVANVFNFVAGRI